MKSMITMALLLFLVSNVDASATIFIKGKFILPSTPLHMLIGQMLSIDSSLDQEQFRKDLSHPGEDFSYPGQKIGISHYPPLEPGPKFPYSYSFQVLAVPLKGPHREQRDFSNPDLAKRPFFLGTMSDDGNYTIEAPAHPGEYLIVIQSDRACFKRLVIASGMEGTIISNQNVDLESTVFADLNLWLERQGIFLPQQKVHDKFEHVLKEHVILMDMDLREGKVSPKQLRQYGLMAFARALEMRLARKRLDDSRLPAPRAQPEYDLSFLGSTQKLQKLLVEVWRELKRLKRPQQVLLASDEMLEAKVVHPKVIVDRELFFFPSGLRSWGANIKSLPSSQNPHESRSLPFEIRTYSEFGELIDIYRWWTPGKDSGFFGFTGPQKFYSLEIKSPALSSLEVFSVIGSQRYSKVSDELWRAQGNWQKVAPKKSKKLLQASRSSVNKTTPLWVFDHYWRQVSSPMKIDGKCTFDYNSSAGTRWKWMPPVSNSDQSLAEQYLISPSVQLSHFPVEEEDIVTAQDGTFASWVSGTWKGLDELEVLPGLPPCSQYSRTISQNARLRSQGEAGLKKAQYRDAARASHWGHLHFQSKTAGNYFNSRFKPKIEYSLDNGHTWIEAWWYNDEFHHGQLDRWWGVEIDLFADSDLAKRSAGGECKGSDFNQDGKNDFQFDVGGDGRINEKDCRQWDTRFFHYPQTGPIGIILPSAPEKWLSLIPGTNILVRFAVSVDHPDEKKQNNQDEEQSWEIDDVSINGDIEELGFFTDFDTYHIPWD